MKKPIAIFLAILGAVVFLNSNISAQKLQTTSVSVEPTYDYTPIASALEKSELKYSKSEKNRWEVIINTNNVNKRIVILADKDVVSFVLAVSKTPDKDSIDFYKNLDTLNKKYFFTRFYTVDKTVVMRIDALLKNMDATLLKENINRIMVISDNVLKDFPQVKKDTKK